ncbi:small GTP-binding protein [Histomonas meleagridis]|uniref:small GTP-binding protein n=1 Tax=Histomonas meleagridis TaxID=135588 RepID=UPI00355A96D3|nr:small GTP-binding protein [Histomonas meleagridis]KAH0806056.1 small GTP-binding protein [Histomonas meleagridis]
MLISKNNSFHCRVVLIGDASVGKTCLLGQLIDNKFNPSEQSTIGANYQIYNEEIDGIKAEVQIWDTAGQEKFRSLGPIYFRNALGAVAVFDITNKSTFDHLDEWIKSFTDASGTESTIFVVANKSDMVQEQKISFSQVQAYAEQRGYRAFETSAKTGQGVQELFSELAKTILNKHREVKVTKQELKPSEGGCKC